MSNIEFNQLPDPNLTLGHQKAMVTLEFLQSLIAINDPTSKEGQKLIDDLTTVVKLRQGPIDLKGA